MNPSISKSNLRNPRFKIIALILLMAGGIILIPALSVSMNSTNSTNPARTNTSTSEMGGLASTQTGKAQKKSRIPQAPGAQAVVGPNLPSAVTITATLTDNVTPNTTKVSPGSTINYTAIINSTGTTDAAAVAFNDVIDPNTTLVAGSVHASPVAANETYNWVGNTFLDTSARALPSVLANDTISSAPDTIVLTTLAAAPTTLGGTVTLAANGHFTYTPPLGRPNIADGASVNDTFTYTVKNSVDATLASTGTVTINLSGRVWYLQAGAAGDGRSNTPSGNPAAISTSADKSTDIIYVYFNASTLNGAITLDPGQQLIGQGVALVVNAITLIVAGSTPTIQNTTGNAVTLGTPAGNNILAGFNIGNTSGVAITGANVGTLNISTVSINTTGAGLDLTGVGSPTVNIVLGGLTSTSGAKNVNLVGLNGTITLANGALSGATGNAFDVSSGNAGITFSGPISNSGGRQVSIVNKNGGTVALSGSVSGTGTGIFLNNNGGTTMNFTGGVVLSTTTNDAFTATGGGTITVTGAANTLTTTTGQALKVISTTIAATGLTFRNITAGTGAGSAGNGITLDTTGALGGLTVTGTGSAGTGGTIQHKTGADLSTTQGIGIYLNSTSNAQFSWMQLNDFDNFAIRGLGVTNFRFDNSVISGISGNVVSAADEAAISFDGLNGSASISNCNISGGFEYVIKILNNSGTLDRLLVNSTTIGGNHDAAAGNGGDAFQIVTNNSATANLTVTNCTFTSAGGDPFDAIAHNTSNMDVVFKSNNVSNNHVNQAGASSSVIVFSTSTGNVTYDVSNNTVIADTVSAIHNTSNGIAVAKGIPDTGAGGSMSGTVNGNTIGQNGVVNSGSAFTGIFASALGTGTHTTAITNNTVFHYNEEGIFLKSNDPLTGGTAVLNATVTGNITTQPDPLAFAGLWVLSGSGSGTENHTINLVLGDVSAAAVPGSPTGSLQNDFTAGDPGNFSDVEIQELGSNSTINLSKAGSGSGTIAAVVADDNVGTPAVDSFGTAINLVTAQTVRLISPAPISVLEDGANNITYTFLRYGDTSAGLTVNFNVSGTATFGTDYSQSGAATFTTTTGTVTFPAATDLVKVTIDPTVDANAESDETAILTVAAGAGYTVASPSTATTTIRNDDPVPPIAAPDPAEPAALSSGPNSASVTNSEKQPTSEREAIRPSYAVFNMNDSFVNNSSIAFASFRPGNTMNENAIPASYAAAQKTSPNVPQTTVTQNIGALPAGKSVTIKFAVTVNNPPGAAQVSTQGTVSATGIANVLTDDPDTVASPPPPDPTVTLIDLTITWAGGTSTNWDTGANWNTTLAPVAINDV
ncbi:MAG TPA: Ig-like domain-containing protein, partial [Blastocatellia bacterium]|nr:Ig-like domain-containing protein [Blastocatellia bacterium]